MGAKHFQEQPCKETGIGAYHPLDLNFSPGELCIWSAESGWQGGGIVDVGKIGIHKRLDRSGILRCIKFGGIVLWKQKWQEQPKLGNLFII